MTDRFRLNLVKPGFASLECIVQVKQACLVIQRARGEILYRFPPCSILDVQFNQPQTCAVKVLLPGNLDAAALLVGYSDTRDAEQLSRRLSQELREAWKTRQPPSSDGVFAAEALRLQSVLLKGPASSFAFLGTADIWKEMEERNTLAPRRSSLMSKRKIAQTYNSEAPAPARVSFRTRSQSGSDRSSQANQANGQQAVRQDTLSNPSSIDPEHIHTMFDDAHVLPDSQTSSTTVQQVLGTNELQQQMEVITEMLEAARAIAQKSLQEQEGMKAELARAIQQLSSAEQAKEGSIAECSRGRSISQEECR
ncbi:hypothetical protein WJX84_006026 [Apatococcus fuscideae]|uniref:Uncharacterized protein n=1 Tax=Apatococcus fuscideae TaxID=2026836 RepID=A0AAW1TK67_9CHLO